MMNEGEMNMYDEIVARLEDAWQCSEIAEDLNVPLSVVERIMFEAYGVLPDDEE